MRNHLVKTLASQALGLHPGVGSLTHVPQPHQPFDEYWQAVRHADDQYLQFAQAFDVAAYAAATRPQQARSLRAALTATFGLHHVTTLHLGGHARDLARLRTGSPVTPTPADIRDALLVTNRYPLNLDPRVLTERDWPVDEAVTRAEQHRIHTRCLRGPEGYPDALTLLRVHAQTPPRSNAARYTRLDLATVLVTLVPALPGRQTDPDSERAVLLHLQHALEAVDAAQVLPLAQRWLAHPRATRLPDHLLRFP